jgi:hypothetical protein
MPVNGSRFPLPYFDEEQDLDPDLYQSERSDPDPQNSDADSHYR